MSVRLPDGQDVKLPAGAGCPSVDADVFFKGTNYLVKNLVWDLGENQAPHVRIELAHKK